MNWTSFIISTDNITLVTDPVALKDSGLALSKTKTDIVLFTDPKLEQEEDILVSKGIDNKIVSDKRSNILELKSPGEFEIGGLMIRRDIGNTFFSIDESTLRVVYLGLADNDFNVDSTKDLGDVDILIAPIGNGDQFIDYDKLEKIFSNIDPHTLIPCGFKESGLKLGSEMKTKDDFIKHFGFTNVREETSLNVKPSNKEPDEAPMEIVLL